MPTWYLAGNERLRGAVAATAGGGTGVAPILDTGAGAFIASIASASSLSLSHSSGQYGTTGTNRIIAALLVAANIATGGAPAAFSTPTGTTVTGWTQRKVLTYTESGGRGGGRVRIEVWWALAASALGANSEDLTMSLSAGSSDILLMDVLPVIGCNTTAPWDPNGTLPATAAVQEGTNFVITGESITNSGTLGLMILTNETTAGLGVPTTPSGWTSNGNVNLTNTLLAPYTQAFTTPQSGSFNFTTTSSGTNFGAIGGILDALTS